MSYSSQLLNIRCYREKAFAREIFPNAISFDVSNAPGNGAMVLNLQNKIDSLFVDSRGF
jgi:hypothetical protein